MTGTPHLRSILGPAVGDQGPVAGAQGGQTLV